MIVSLESVVGIKSHVTTMDDELVLKAFMFDGGSGKRITFTRLAVDTSTFQ